MLSSLSFIAAIALAQVDSRADGALAAPNAAQDQAVTPPKVKLSVNASYPQGKELAAQSGDLVLAVVVGIDGTVTEATVAESGGADFDAAALEAVKKWTFAPAQRGKTPVPAKIRIPFHFNKQPDAPQPAGAVPQPAAAQANSPAATQPSAAAAPANSPQPAAAQPSAAAAPIPVPGEIEVNVRGKVKPPTRGAADYQVDVGHLREVPRQNAAEMLKLAPGILLTNEGGEGHAEQVFLRGFDAREGQDIEFSVDGVPINQSGNLHGNGYVDSHFIIPELVESLRVLEGPFDPRQGNYAVAGSTDYHLGLEQRGLTVKYSTGNYGTTRELLMYGDPSSGPGNFSAAELYQTAGYGQNRDGRRGTVMLQREGQLSDKTRFRFAANAYLSSFHTAGVISEDQYRSGQKGFFDTNDSRQGEDTSRVSLAAEIETSEKKFRTSNLTFFTATPLHLRENFTGFLLDVQEPLQQPHPQRGDLIDLTNMSYTFGDRGFARYTDEVFGLTQEFEVGFFAREDFVEAKEQRIEAATGHPYMTDTDIESKLGDIGLYADLNLKFARWLSLRGGVRTDLFTYDVNDKCAVHSVEHPSQTNPPGDASCLSQQGFAQYREPNQGATTNSSAIMPRVSLLIVPFQGVTLSASTGEGIRSIDPTYISQDAKTPFASVDSKEIGLTYEGSVAAGLRVAAKVAGFKTTVDKDLIFSQTAGRNLLGGATVRTGTVNSIRLTGQHFDLSANATFVKAKFADSGLLIPYIPDLVLRSDLAIFGILPYTEFAGPTGIKSTFSLGATYVGPRPLPYGTRSDPIETLDGNLTFGWAMWEVGLAVQNITNKTYRLGEYNYPSDFHASAFPTLVPERHFSAGSPETYLASISLHLGGQ